MELNLTPQERVAFELSLSTIVQSIVSKQARMDGQGILLSPTVRFSDDGSKLDVDLGEGYVPAVNGGEFEDHLRAISAELTYHLEKIHPVMEVAFLFGGKDVYFYFPESRRPTPAQIPIAAAGANQSPRVDKGKVLISAGHGLYFHRGYKDWRAAREVVNGMTEDFMTPIMASDLATYLDDRSGVETVQVRSEAMTSHVESGQPWWKLGARYHLKNLYPSLASVWNSKGDQDYPLVERDEDIYSRPSSQIISLQVLFSKYILMRRPIQLFAVLVFTISRDAPRTPNWRQAFSTT